jgi:Skp family chaperone for outer membrane proteins
LDRQKQRRRSSILKDITDALERVGRTEGYTAILDSSGFSFNGVPVVIFSDSRFDITREVVELLNLGGPSQE